MNLYEITGQMKALMAMDDLPYEALQDTLGSLGFDEKVESCVVAIKNLKAQEQAFKTEIDNLAARKKALGNKIINLQHYVSENMQAIGKDKVESGVHAVTLKKSAKQLAVTDENLVPENFKVTETRIEKKVLLSALKDGFEVPGAKLIDGKRALLIK